MEVIKNTFEVKYNKSTDRPFFLRNTVHINCLHNIKKFSRRFFLIHRVCTTVMFPNTNLILLGQTIEKDNENNPQHASDT